MLLKRKRSDAELSYGSMFASTQQLNGDSFNFDAISAMETARRGFFSPRQPTPSHLHSRTMKRFRDNRPAESEVYRKLTQDTLSHLTFTYQSPRHFQNTRSTFSIPPSSLVLTNPTTTSRHHLPSLRMASRIPSASPTSDRSTASGTYPIRQPQQPRWRRPPPLLPRRFRLRVSFHTAYQPTATTAAWAWLTARMI